MPIADEGDLLVQIREWPPGQHAPGLIYRDGLWCAGRRDHGNALLLSELTLTTALRTAAMSAVAARALARPGSRSMALIGNGAQSEFQAWLSTTCWASPNCVFSIRTVEATHKCLPT